MKQLLFFIVVALSINLFALPKGFTDDYDKAVKECRKTGKPIYAVFSGSDWCYWCKHLDEKYWSKKEFVEEAEKHFVLLYIDSPNNPSLLTKKVAKQNASLEKKFNVNTFPAFFFIDKKGKSEKAPRPMDDVPAKDYASSLIKAVKLK